MTRSGEMWRALAWAGGGLGALALAAGITPEPGRRAAPPPTAPPPEATEPHGSHTPQHGGQFFMAADNRHHLEGVYPSPGLFHLFVYDDYSRPLRPRDLHQVTGRVVITEVFDPATRTTHETLVHPLTRSRDGRHLEARVGRLAVPAAITAKIRFTADGPEHRFDFTFNALPPPPGAAPAASAAAPTVPVTPPAAVASIQPGEAAPMLEAPAPVSEVTMMLARMEQASLRISELIAAGTFEDVYRPAFEAKDLAVALDGHRQELPRARREAAGEALSAVIRSAWMLDMVGDLGNRQHVIDSYARFTAALADVHRLYGP